MNANLAKAILLEACYQLYLIEMAPMYRTRGQFKYQRLDKKRTYKLL